LRGSVDRLPGSFGPAEGVRPVDMKRNNHVKSTLRTSLCLCCRAVRKWAMRDNTYHGTQKGQSRPTFALNTPRLIVVPAQFRTSVAKRLGSGLSCLQSQFNILQFHLVSAISCSSCNLSHPFRSFPDSPALSFPVLPPLNQTESYIQ
jgi:hypothetical protein